MLLSALLHVLVALLLVAMARLLPPVEGESPLQERTVEVVMVPPPAPQAQPTPSPQLGERLELTPPNLSDDARIAEESVLPPAPEVSQAERSEPTAAPAPTTPLPAPRLERSTPREAPEPVLPPRQTQPAPPQQAAEPVQPPPPAAPPTPPQPERQMVIVVPPMQLEEPPRPEPPPPPRPQARPQFQPRFQPEPRAAPQGRGELREIDLFGPGRQAPRQTAAASRAGAPGPLVREATRSEGDFILRQVVRHWQLNYRDPRYRDMAFVPGSVTLLSDGTLAPPYGRNDPWDPYAMIVNYGEITARGREEERYVVDTFLTALRAAQPFQLPPTGGSYPRRIRMNFRLGDL